MPAVPVNIGAVIGPRARVQVSIENAGVWRVYIVSVAGVIVHQTAEDVICIQPSVVGVYRGAQRLPTYQSIRRGDGYVHTCG
jgi:hypothetical protein